MAIICFYLNRLLSVFGTFFVFNFNTIYIRIFNALARCNIKFAIIVQVTLHVANGHSFVNAMLFLVLHRGLRQAAADACCNSLSTVAGWLTAGWSPEPYTLEAVMPGASPEPVLAVPPPPPPSSMPAYTIRHTSMRVNICLNKF